MLCRATLTYGRAPQRRPLWGIGDPHPRAIVLRIESALPVQVHDGEDHEVALKPTIQQSLQSAGCEGTEHGWATGVALLPGPGACRSHAKHSMLVDCSAL